MAQEKVSSELSIDTAALRKHVTELAEQQPPRCYDYPEGLQMASQYIQNEWTKQGWVVEIQKFSDGDRAFENVIVKYNPEKRERIVIGAHYDVCGHHPGADDNASGIAGLLELSKHLKEQKPDLPYCIEFVAFSTEEPPYFRSNLMGSYVHAASLKKSAVKVRLMIVLEMIGYYSNEPNSQSYPLKFLKWFYPTRANFIAFVARTKEMPEIRKLKQAFKSKANIPFASINTPFVFEGIDYSDHRNYWLMGYKAIMVTNTSFFRNGNYHTLNDRPETLDYHKMGEVVRGIYYTLFRL